MRKLFKFSLDKGKLNEETTVFPHIVSAETILFWIFPYVLWPLITVHKCVETIQGRKLFKGGNYSRAETIWGNTVVSSLNFPLCNENLNSFLTRWGNYSRRGSYSREETIWGNTVSIDKNDDPILTKQYLSEPSLAMDLKGAYIITYVCSTRYRSTVQEFLCEYLGDETAYASTDWKSSFHHVIVRPKAKSF